MKQGDRATRQQLTARVYIQPEGDTSGYIDLGDLEGHKLDLTREGADILERKSGYHQKIGNNTAVVGMGYEFKLREIFGFLQAALLRGTQGADSSQGSLVAPNGTAQFVGVKQGRTLHIGKHNVNTVVVSVSAAPKTLGTDYTVDLNCGTIYIIPGGGIADAATVDVTFGCGALSFENFTALDAAGAKYGLVKLQELDQHANTPRNEISGTYQYMVDAGIDHDGKKPAVPTLKLIYVSGFAQKSLK